MTLPGPQRANCEIVDFIVLNNTTIQITTQMDGIAPCPSLPPQGGKGTEARRWWRFASRAFLAALLALLLALMPLPATVPAWLIVAQWPVTIFLAIALIGKALYDTLFWDRYH